MLIPIAAQLFVNQVMGLYGPVWRYAPIEEAVRRGRRSIGIFADVRTGVVRRRRHDTAAAHRTAGGRALLLGCGGIRFQARLFALERQRDGKSTRLRTLLVGTTDAGVALALELEGRTFGDSLVVGFVDDNASLVGRSVRALRVLGTTRDLEEVCKRERIERIVIALPDASREERSEIETRALKTDAQVKVLAGASDPTASRCSTACAISTSPTSSAVSTLSRPKRHRRLPKAPTSSSPARADRSAARSRARSRSTGRPPALLDRDDSLLFEVAVVARQGGADPRRHPR